MSLPVRSFLLFGLFSLLITMGCGDSHLPPDTLLKSSILGNDSEAKLRILGNKQINLDEDPDLETLVLSQSKQSETLAAFSKRKGEWTFLWKITFNMQTLGDYYYDGKSLNWVAGTAPGSEKSAMEGDCIKRIVLAELPGDQFNSVFVEILSEEPPLGLFSIPMGYRKGKKILDGLALLKDHENTIKKKKVPFEYVPKEKSIRVFPNEVSYSIEFVYNGWEMIPQINGQPIPSLLETKIEPPLEIGKESKVTLTFKNRGGSSGLTYLSFSFPNSPDVHLEGNNPYFKLYSIASPVYHNIQKKKVSSEVPLIEQTKEGWGTNFKSSISFYLTPVSKTTKVLFRVSYRAYREDFHLPDQFSVANPQIDQQGFYAYPISL